MTSYEDWLQCLLCLETLKNPRKLRCGHVFCQECLQNHFVVQLGGGAMVNGNAALNCPTCREPTPLPGAGTQALPMDAGSDRLRTLFSSVAVKAHCDACRAEKKTVRAREFCLDCSKSLCESCLKLHDKNAAMRGHQMVIAGALCGQHSGEQIRYLCQQCNALACTVCVMRSHDSHDVVDLARLARKQMGQLKRRQATLDAAAVRLRERLAVMDQLRAINLQGSLLAERAVKDHTRRLLEATRLQEKQLLGEIRRRRDDNLIQLESRSNIAGTALAHAARLQAFSDKMLETNSLRMLAMHDDLAQRMTIVAEEAPTLTNDVDLQTHLSFTPGPMDPHLGRIDDVKGTMEELSHITDAMPITFLTGSMMRGPSNVARSRISPTKGVRPRLLLHIDKVGTNAGELRDPLAVCCLLNGDLVVAEWANRRLQVFDTVGCHVRFLGGPISPQGLATTLRGNVMVTDASSKRLDVFSPSGERLSRWGLGKFFNPCGIGTCPDGNCVITDCAEHSVSVYQGEKKCLKRFGSRGFRNNEFDSPLYVTVSKDNLIFVSDSGNHCIKVYDQKGNFIRKFGERGSADGQLMFPRGVCLDSDGHVIVADRNNDRICMFSADGRFIKHLLTRDDNVTEPYGVAITVSRNLVITECGLDCASLKIFEHFRNASI